MKKIYKKLAFYGLPTAILLVTMFVAISITHGWYTNVDIKGEINANTKNSGFKYKVDGKTLAKDEYSISNLTFFDIDSLYEGKFFHLMSYCLELEVENITEDNLEYTVTFEADKYVSGNSNSYVGCIMSPTKLEYQLAETGEAGATYMVYDNITHKYTENTSQVSEGDDLSGENLAKVDYDYMSPYYDNTKDDVVKRNKTYYTSTYDEMITRGNKVPANNSKYYEKLFNEGSTYNTYQAFTTAVSQNDNKIYTKVESQSGIYYAEVTDEGELSSIDSSNYTNYCVWNGNYGLTQDSLFQNETYYLYSNSVYQPLTTIKPSDKIPTSNGKKTYYEKGSIVKDLIVNSYEEDINGDDDLTKPIVEYTPNYNSANSFMAKYYNGQLGITSATKNQVLYLYLFGVQEIDSATNPDFIEDIHNFTITISATVDSSWTAEDITND